MDWDALRKSHDPGDYFTDLIEFPQHVQKALDQMEGFEFSFKPKSILVCGMGGSAIPGYLLKTYGYQKIKQYIDVANGYDIPAWVDGDTLVFVISYSGNTEEALSCLKQAMAKGCKIILISAGGLIQKAAKKYGYPYIKAPGKLQPRAATPYLFTYLLEVLRKIGLISPNYEEAMYELKKVNLKDIGWVAEQLLGKYVYIYTPSHLEAVGRRLQAQDFNENAKILAKYSVLPEANHNELTAFGECQELPLATIFLWDKDVSSSLNVRTQFTMDICKEKGEVLVLHTRGKSLLSKMLTLIYQGDIVSYHLCLLRHKNPLPVPLVEKMKKVLKKKTNFKEKLVKSLGLV